MRTIGVSGAGRKVACAWPCAARRCATTTAHVRKGKSVQTKENDPLLKVSTLLGGPLLLQWHHENGVDLSADDYLHRYQVIRSAGMESSQRIYLDTNYWVRIREAHLGLRDGVWLDLLNTLRARVRDRSAVCLFNYWNFAEIARQTPERLHATCELIDELCERNSLVSPDDLEELQAAEYVASRLGFDYTSSLDRWTCVARLHRTALPAMPDGLRPDQVTAMTKAIWDTLLSAGMFELMEALGWENGSVYGARHIDEQTIAAVEALKAQRIAQKLTRKQVRVEEFDSVVRDHYAQRFARSFIRFCARRNTLPDSRQVDATVRNLIALASDDFRHDRLGRLLPQAALMSELSALYFSNAQLGRPTDNDYVDWQHAATALPHSHIFLTERRLRAQLEDLHAGERYGCEVFNDEEAALEFLRKQ